MHNKFQKFYRSAEVLHECTMDAIKTFHHHHRCHHFKLYLNSNLRLAVQAIITKRNIQC